MRRIARASQATGIPVGDIEFYDKMVPPLLAGDYSATISQTLTFDSTNETFQRLQKFSVQTPRFGLNLADVQSVFPAAGSTGQFENILPQIVLNKRTLPWELLLEKGDTPGTPWMALLVLDAEQIMVPANSSSAPTATLAASFQLGDVANLNAGGLLGPVISHLDYGQANTDIICTIDLSTDTFKALVPQESELPLLAHCREVNMEHKEILDMMYSGWFSLVVANRFPINPDKPTRQFVHLVSLEGFKPYLTANPSFPTGVSVIRLVSLYSWSFTSLPDHGESFSSFMLHLVSDTSEQNTDLLFKMPLSPDNAAKDTSPNKIASKALQNGFVPMTYRTRFGDQTLSWYRGPLSPVKPDEFTRNPDMSHFAAASDAVIFDPSTGLFDLSYSVAWQTGRLMALADSGFSTSLMDWRRKINRFIDLLANLAQEDKLANFLDNFEGSINQWFHEQLITSSFMDFILNEFSTQIAPKLPGSPVAQLASANDGTGAGAADDDLPPELVTELQKLLQDEQVQSLLGDLEGREFTNLVEWLARTSLLYNVPFDHIVPDPRLLPIESIRFFYFDRGWIDSLVDGAMSIGVQSSKDSHYYKITKDIIRDAVAKLILQVREKLLGFPLSDKDPTDGVIAGFLLRSAVLTQHPGIEIKGYRTITQNDDRTLEGADRMQLLRMERLSPNVLICLFPDTPAWIEFDEPKEGLCFGVEPVEAKLEIGIRDPANGELMRENVYTLDDKADFRGDMSFRVLNIAHLNTALAQKLSMASMNSADFALQLVKVPEQMVFQNKE
jgi:hypothetical protein